MVLVDTCVWSILLRRRRKSSCTRDDETRYHLTELIQSGNTVMIGPIRQEVLTGIQNREDFTRLQQHLSFFDDEQLVTMDYEGAAKISNMCTSKGIAVSAIDALICAVAIHRGISVFTTDRDFLRYASVCDVQLHGNTLK